MVENDFLLGILISCTFTLVLYFELYFMIKNEKVSLRKKMAINLGIIISICIVYIGALWITTEIENAKRHKLYMKYISSGENNESLKEHLDDYAQDRGYWDIEEWEKEYSKD